MSQQIVMSAAPIVRSSPSSDLSREALLRIADAGIKVVDCVRDVRACGSTLIIEALGRNNEFTEWEHYPPNDVHDPKGAARRGLATSACTNRFCDGRRHQRHRQ